MVWKVHVMCIWTTTLSGWCVQDTRTYAKCSLPISCLWGLMCSSIWMQYASLGRMVLTKNASIVGGEKTWTKRNGRKIKTFILRHWSKPEHENTVTATFMYNTVLIYMYTYMYLNPWFEHIVCGGVRWMPVVESHCQLVTNGHKQHFHTALCIKAKYN